VRLLLVNARHFANASSLVSCDDRGQLLFAVSITNHLVDGYLSGDMSYLLLIVLLLKG